MATYQIVASSPSRQRLIVADSVPENIDLHFRGYIYDTLRKQAWSTGPEVFSRGYWTADAGEVEIQPNEIVR